MNIETANRLYELRKKSGLSQEELAEKLGVSRQAVSKWERSESSPDTDNLIALARLYDLSLDELIYGEKMTFDQKEDKTDNSQDINSEDRLNNDSTDEADDDYDQIDVKPEGVVIESKNGDKVKINLKGIKVNSSNGDEIKIGLNGITINASEFEEDDEFDDDEKEIIRMSNGKAKLWLSIPYPIVCAITYLLFGFLDICGGWALSWIIFATIPLYYSLIEAIFKKSFSEFAYPIFTVFAYLFAGLYLSNWHPSWIIFLTIPIYYPIAHALDKLIKKGSK
jgi:transcriptional regulator with XRE-family HTH domain